jgi:hypothetical protein
VSTRSLRTCTSRERADRRRRTPDRRRCGRRERESRPPRPRRALLRAQIAQRAYDADRATILRCSLARHQCRRGMRWYPLLLESLAHGEARALAHARDERDRERGERVREQEVRTARSARRIEKQHAPELVDRPRDGRRRRECGEMRAQPRDRRRRCVMGRSGKGDFCARRWLRYVKRHWAADRRARCRRRRWRRAGPRPLPAEACQRVPTRRDQRRPPTVQRQNQCAGERT